MLAAITGACDTAVGELPGSSCMRLHAEAALGAVADAGLALSDIDVAEIYDSFTITRCWSNWNPSASSSAERPERPPPPVPSAWVGSCPATRTAGCSPTAIPALRAAA